MPGGPLSKTCLSISGPFLAKYSGRYLKALIQFSTSLRTLSLAILSWIQFSFFSFGGDLVVGKFIATDRDGQASFQIKAAAVGENVQFDPIEGEAFAAFDAGGVRVGGVSHVDNRDGV